MPRSRYRAPDPDWHPSKPSLNEGLVALGSLFNPIPTGKAPVHELEEARAEAGVFQTYHMFLFQCHHFVLAEARWFLVAIT